jgi:uncharacterized protein (DUF488 family)
MPKEHRLTLPSASVKQQHENRLLWNDSRSIKESDFFTFGYTGRKIEELIDAMLKANVQSLVDIRKNPVSMYRPELSKNNLKRHVEEHGICYVHYPDLGVPRDIRAKAIDTGTRDVIWDWYDANVVDQFIGKNLHRFLNCAEHPVALMCVEIDPRECHRHRLFLALESNGLRGFDL